METALHQQARSQSGVLLYRDARRLGWRWHDFQGLIREEGWTRLFRGAYLMPGTPDTPIVRARAIQLLRPKLIASHQLAAFIHGWGMVHPPRLDFTGRDGSRVDIPGGRLYRWQIRASDVIVVHGIRVTSPLRTAVDLLRTPSRDTGVLAVDTGLREKTVSLDAIADRLEHLAGERGVRHAWRAFICLDPKSGGVTESQTRLILWDLKLYPATQVKVEGVDGKTYYFDFLLDGIVIEPEGFTYHGDAEAHEADTARFNALAAAARACGYDFIRLTYRAVFTQRRQVEQLILRTLRARRQRLGVPDTASRVPA